MDDQQAAETNPIVNVDQGATVTNENDSTSITNYLCDPTLYIDNEIFFVLINDIGCPNIDNKTGLKCTRKPRKTHYNKADDRLYRNIWQLGYKLYEIYHRRTNVLNSTIISTFTSYFASMLI